jgi:hypothetical protein
MSKTTAFHPVATQSFEMFQRAVEKLFETPLIQRSPRLTTRISQRSDIIAYEQDGYKEDELLALLMAIRPFFLKSDATWLEGVCTRIKKMCTRMDLVAWALYGQYVWNSVLDKSTNYTIQDQNHTYTLRDALDRLWYSGRFHYTYDHVKEMDSYPLMDLTFRSQAIKHARGLAFALNLVDAVINKWRTESLDVPLPPIEHAHLAVAAYYRWEKEKRPSNRACKHWDWAILDRAEAGDWKRF